MGNIQFQCPVEFDRHPTSILACVAKCPSEKGYEIRNVNGTLACTHKRLPENYVTLKSVQAISRQVQPGRAIPPVSSFEALKEVNPALYNQYAEEYTRFNKDFAVVDAKVGKDQKIQDAFRALQDAENARDTSPEAYEDARIRYYTLTKGETWLEEERQRIAKADVAPIINQYTNQYSDLKQRSNQQQRTIDIVNGVKDKLLSVQDELATNVNAFSRQIDGLKNMINMERRKAVEEKVSSYAWIGNLLNILLIIAILGAIVTILRKLLSRQPEVAQPSIYTLNK